MEINNNYCGYETGPIRPPSEAESLLLRVSRNCPWNKCRFCGLYKNKKFSIRRPEHVIADIEAIKFCIDTIKSVQGELDIQAARQRIGEELGQGWEYAYIAAAHWYRSGAKSVFLQDADSMLIKTDDMVRILKALKSSFPKVERVTTYSRSDAVARKSDEDLVRIKEAGLDRLHIGMETGSDRVLRLVCKGAEKATHVLAGQKAKKAGFELSEYYMPGLGGKEYWQENALETADALNRINPDYIRIRSFALTERGELCEDYRKGALTRANDIQTAEEILLMLNNLKGITSTIVSDHIVNLIPDVRGKLPDDQPKMADAIQWFLDLPDADKLLFRIGRRTNAMKMIADFYDEAKRMRTQRYIEQEAIDDANVDDIVDMLMSRFI